MPHVDTLDSTANFLYPICAANITYWPTLIMRAGSASLGNAVKCSKALMARWVQAEGTAFKAVIALEGVNIDADLEEQSHSCECSSWS